MFTCRRILSAHMHVQIRVGIRSYQADSDTFVYPSGKLMALFASPLRAPLTNPNKTRSEISQIDTYLRDKRIDFEYEFTDVW